MSESAHAGALQSCFGSSKVQVQVQQSNHGDQHVQMLAWQWIISIISSTPMPPHVPAELKLDGPLYEEDIGDLSPYVALPLSTSSRTSSTTINTSYSAWSTFTRSELDSGTPFSACETHRMLNTPRKDLTTFVLHLFLCCQFRPLRWRILKKNHLGSFKQKLVLLQWTQMLSLKRGDGYLV